MKKLILFMLFFMASLPLFGFKQPLILVPLKSGYDIYWYFWEGQGDLSYHGHTNTIADGPNDRYVIELPVVVTTDTEQKFIWVGGWDNIRKKWVYAAWHYIGGTSEMEAVLDLDNWLLDWWMTGKTSAP